MGYIYDHVGLVCCTYCGMRRDLLPYNHLVLLDSRSFHMAYDKSRAQVDSSRSQLVLAAGIRSQQTHAVADAVQLGHEFVSAQQEDRPPTINDLWEDEILPLGPYVITALCAREIHHRDVHYIVRDGEIKIVSTSTGRVLSQSRWMDGLHQVYHCHSLLSYRHNHIHAWFLARDSFF